MKKQSRSKISEILEDPEAWLSKQKPSTVFAELREMEDQRSVEDPDYYQRMNTRAEDWSALNWQVVGAEV